MHEELCSLKSPVLPPLKDLHFCCLKMFPDCFRTTTAGRLRPSSVRWMNWGTMSRGKCLTARISESPSPARECILSDILEENVPAKYFLSQAQMERLLSKSYQGRRDAGSTPPAESPSPWQATLEASVGAAGFMMWPCPSRSWQKLAINLPAPATASTLPMPPWTPGAAGLEIKSRILLPLGTIRGIFLSTWTKNRV